MTEVGAWRPMSPVDLPNVRAVAAVVHPDFPEDAAVFAERLSLYPAGCAVFDVASRFGGYVLAHPWLFGQPPTLNTRLGRLPDRATTLYLHDLAIRPECRGGGAGRRAVERLAVHARQRGLPSLSLIAVGDSPRFWRGLGFEIVADSSVASVLGTYADAVFMARAVA